MKQRQISIIILTWNGLEYTKKCLDSLHSSVQAMGCQVYVADNGSSDGTLEYLQGLDWIQVISHQENQQCGDFRDSGRGHRSAEQRYDYLSGGLAGAAVPYGL